MLFQLLVAKRSGTSAWCGWWPWLASLGVILVWTIFGIKFVPAFYHVVFEKEFLGRFESTVHRAQPLLFYLVAFVTEVRPMVAPHNRLCVLCRAASERQCASLSRNAAPETLWLLFWSIGGLVLMSLVPSKRVDRIYPVLPPLCLLLSAQVADLLQHDETHALVLKWSVVGLLFSIVFSGGYAASKIVSNYRDHADNLENFSNQVNAEVAAHHWRFEVIEGKGGGSQEMLLYLQKLHFIPVSQAIKQWNAGALDALVVPTTKSTTCCRNCKTHQSRLSDGQTPVDSARRVSACDAASGMTARRAARNALTDSKTLADHRCTDSYRDVRTLVSRMVLRLRYPSHNATDHLVRDARSILRGNAKS